MQQHRRVRFVPQFSGERVVAEEVEKFATDRHLVWQAYHQDEPVWYVSQEQREGSSMLIRIVQIAAVYGEVDLDDTEDYYLWAIPFAQEIDEANRVGWTLEHIEGGPHRLPASAIKAGEYNVYKLIDAAWATAATIKREDIRKGPGTPLSLKPNWPPT